MAFFRYFAIFYRRISSFYRFRSIQKVNQSLEDSQLATFKPEMYLNRINTVNDSPMIAMRIEMACEYFTNFQIKRSLTQSIPFAAYKNHIGRKNCRKLFFV